MKYVFISKSLSIYYGLTPMNKTQLLKNLGLYEYALFLKEKMTFNFNEFSKLVYNEQLEKDIIIKNNNKKNADIPKIIWMFWDSENIPAEVNLFKERIEIDNPEYQLNLVTFKNLNLYLDELVFDENIEIPIANKSDVIRLALLYKYGGIWLDITTILLKPLSWFLQIDNINNFDLIAFYREKSTTDFSRPIIENWFLAAPPNSEFIKKWYEALAPLLTMGAKKYFFKLKENSNYTQISQSIDRPDYLLAYLAAQLVLLNHPTQYNFYLRKCENNAFLIHENVKWDAIKINSYLAFKNIHKTKGLPIVKITSIERTFLKYLLQSKLINANSIYGSLYKDKKR